MNAVILCAGFATRMYPLTRDFPKPLLPVADRPVIDYLMDQIAELPGLQAVHVISNRKFIDHYATWREVLKRSDGPEGVCIELHDNGVTTNEKRLGAAAARKAAKSTVHLELPAALFPKTLRLADTAKIC